MKNQDPQSFRRLVFSRRVQLMTLIFTALVAAASASAETGLGLDADNIATGRFTYITSLQIGNIDSQIESIRDISADRFEGRASLRVETVTVTGMGETVDLLQLDAATLYPLQRRIIQGEGRLELDYADDRVTGLIQAAGQLISVDLALAEPAYAGDAGLDTLLLGLPLREGLSGELRAIETDVDVYVQRFNFVVDAPETVETPAGSFDSWPVRIQAVDDPDYRQTVWLTTDQPRKFVQAEAPVPVEAGGGTLRTQLVNIEGTPDTGRSPNEI